MDAAVLGDLRERVTILASFDEVISFFTEKIEISSEDIKSRLEVVVGASAATVEASATNSMRSEVFAGTLISNWEFSPLNWQSWLDPPSVVIRRVTGGSGHKIGATEFYTAAVDWILVGFARLPDSSMIEHLQPFFRYGQLALIACQWRTKVLFSVGDNPELTVEEYESPTTLDPNGRDALQPLLDSALQPLRSALKASAKQRPPAVSIFIQNLMKARDPRLESGERLESVLSGLRKL